MRGHQNSIRRSNGENMRNLAIAMLVIALPCLSNAQGNRANTWEASLSAIFQESKSISGGAGSSLNVDSDTGIGINFAYNWSNKLSFGMDFEFLQPDYVATLVDDTGLLEDLVINHEMSQFNGRFKGTFNLMDGYFTPFLEAGLGWSYFDSNVQDGPPQTGCWWHPWYGYICNNFYDTFDETLFTYGAGVGVRWEFTGGSFLKASYNYWEMDGMGQSEDSALEAGRLEFGWRF
jgi:opacity protein-like surface antigen